MSAAALAERCGMFEVFYATTRLARIDASDREAAKRRFAAYVLYDDVSHVLSDVALGNGDDAEVAPAAAVPVAGSRDEMRAWFARREAESEPFDVGLFEDPERSLDAYLRLLASNDPWRLEGHGSFGRRLSAIPLFADLITFDRRVAYRFDATQYVDYVRFDSLASLDPARPRESLRVSSLVDVSALRDEGLRQIASSYEAIANEYRLTARYTRHEAPFAGDPFDVTFDAENWRAYVAHRAAEPARFLPPAGWSRS